MKTLHIGLALGAALLIGACATQKVLEATGGSRADGTVSLSFEYGMFERPEVNWDQAQVTATARCKAWGYVDAERFGGGIRHCQQTDMYGACVRTLVTVNYQCLAHGRL